MAEIDLNDLTIKTDSLPDNWKMLLINPTTGQSAQNISIARFIELFSNKLPIATTDSKGIMTPLMYLSLMPDIGRITDCDKKGQYSAVISGGQNGTPPGVEGAIIILSFMGGLPPAYYIQFAIGLNVTYFGMRRHIDTRWMGWQKIGFETSSYSLFKNDLTDHISNSYHLPPPPPRKLRAKLFRIRQFGRAICDFPYVGFAQSGRFNSS